MAINEGDIVRLTTPHGKSVGETTYRVYGLWPRGRVKLRAVNRRYGDRGWITAQPERTKEVAIHFVTKIEE